MIDGGLPGWPVLRRMNLVSTSARSLFIVCLAYLLHPTSTGDVGKCECKCDIKKTLFTEISIVTPREGDIIKNGDNLLIDIRSSGSAEGIHADF